jgi:hypothetical protein
MKIKVPIDINDDNSSLYSVTDWYNINVDPTNLISLRLGFRRNFLSVLHPNLVSSSIKGNLEILNLTTRCIPMDILAWTDCVRSIAGKMS